MRVAALIRSGIKYILVLDLAKAYDTVLKMALIKKLENLIPTNLLNQLRVFIATVVAKVSGDISDTRIPMKRGLTQGGTSSPPLFRVFINDLPEMLRQALREKLPQAIIPDPSILVADDGIALIVTLEQMQVIADTCFTWARENGLNWNPLKSQFLKLLMRLQNTPDGMDAEQEERGRQMTQQVMQSIAGVDDEVGSTVILAGEEVKISQEVDYLGLMVHTERVFICKDIVDMRNRVLGAIHIITKETWFSMNLHPKFIANLYETHVRSILVYGSKLLTHEELSPLVNLDNELMMTFFKGLLKLKSITIATKIRKRLHRVFWVPTI